MTTRKKLMTWSVLIAALTAPVCSARTRSTTGSGGDYVVLLHGLGRSTASMKRLEWTLTRRGYRVVNVSYPSTKVSVQEAAANSLTIISRIQNQDPDAKVHFVTHSMGGIVLREYLANHRMKNLGRVVMIAPPNQGSQLADKLQRHKLYRFLTGPAGQQLGTGAALLPRKLGAADFELGVIAGDRSLNPLFSAIIPGTDDGKVSVANTRLEGMSDFVVLHASHTWLPWRRSVGKATARFLESGQF
jgi:triacylglycerol lipase